ncbi:MAG: AAA family ATPase, partial [Solirubrobacteraceae bacterium]|nr:AAA family ATPase [Patulibacter sp.]
MSAAPHLSELVGRVDELARIDAAIAAVVAGGSRALVLSGEPGIGKTALLSAARSRAAGAGVHVVHGRAAEQEEDVPFGLVVDALDDEAATLAGPDLGRLRPLLGTVLPGLAQQDAATAAAPGDAPVARVAIHRALRDLVDVVAAGRPVALLLDDLHWADEASL